MVLDNEKDTKVKHLEEVVEGGLPDGWVSLKVLEAHWTLLDPDLLPYATSAMQAIATETAEQLGVTASVSDPEVVADLHMYTTAWWPWGTFVSPNNFEWVKKAEKNRQKMIGEEPADDAPAVSPNLKGKRPVEKPAEKRAEEPPKEKVKRGTIK
eukprot:gene24482-29772_t